MATASPVSRPDPAVDTALRSYRESMRDELFNPVSYEDVKRATNALMNLDRDQTRRAVGSLSPKELRQLATEINDRATAGYGGLTQDQKRDFFNQMASDLDGVQLGRLARAFENRTNSLFGDERIQADNDISLLANSIARRSTRDVQADFVRQLAPSSTDEKRISGNGLSNEGRVYDPQARAMAIVLGGMRGDPGSARAALAGLSPEQRQAVLNAGLDRRTNGGGLGPDRNSYLLANTDPSVFSSVMSTVAGTNDPDLKARYFADAAASLSALEASGKKEDAAVVRNSMTEVLLGPGGRGGDTTGIVTRLRENQEKGDSFSAYLKSMISSGNQSQIAEIQNRMRRGNNGDRNPVSFFNEQSPTTGYHENARNAGYFSGALNGAVNSITEDTKARAEAVKQILQYGLGVGAMLAGPSATTTPPPELLFNTAKDSAFGSIADAYNSLRLPGSRVDAARALNDSMLPRVATARLSSGEYRMESRWSDASKSAFDSARDGITGK
jgi:hypothetical protein